jgi:intein/homing endonuclease
MMKNKNFNKELGSQRVFFRTKSLRNEFFTRLRKRFGTWKALRNHFNIYKSRLENFRNGSISLPYATFIAFSKFIDEQDYFFKRITLKNPNWGSVKGGVITYKKHKEIFEKGRKIGVKKPRKSKYLFQFEMPLTSKLCEFIGAFIGDGFTNRYGHNCMTQITGHKELDKDYYFNTLAPIIRLLNPDANPIISIRPDAIRLTINSREFHKLLSIRFCFPAGKKTFSVKIPEEIINSNDLSLINACLRGIFDTDGCVAFDRRKAYTIPYIRIVLQMESRELIKQIHSLLQNQGINSTITNDLRKIQINGIENCRKFVKNIGFSNKRHLDKLKNL